MEYPGSIFKRPARLAVLAVFIIIFCLFAPGVILYTSGYRYDVHNGFWKGTGAISIEALPRQTSVYLNGLLIQKTLPLRLTTIAPGNYTVRLNAPGYYSWQKDIIVSDQKTTYLNHIHLIRKTAPEQLIKKTIDEISLSPDGKFLAFTAAATSGVEIWIWDVNNDAATPFATTTNIGPLRFSWAPSGHLVAAYNPTAPINFFRLFDAERPTWTENIARLVQKPITKWQWRDSIEPEIYYSTEETLNAFLPRIGNQVKISNVNFQDWYMDRGRLWTLVSSSTGETKIIKDAIGFAEQWATLKRNDNMTSSVWQLVNAKQNTAILQYTPTRQLTVISDTKEWNINGQKVTVTPYENWWLIWSPWEIWEYREKEEPTLINRFGEQIQSVDSIDENNTLLLNTTKNVIAFFPNYFTEQPLLPYSVRAVAVNRDRRLLYFAHKDGLWKLDY